MATKRDNLSIAFDALTAELGAEVSRDDLAEYITRLDGIIALVREVKEPHRKTIRVQQSTASRQKRQARVAEALALLAAQEEAAETK